MANCCGTPRPRKQRLIRLGLGLGLGMAAGFAYWYFIGCSSGHCPITSSPVISTIYGGAMGALASNF